VEPAEILIDTYRRLEVRTARDHDLDFLVAEARQFSDFYGTKIPLFPGEERARIAFKNLMEKHLVLISEIDGERTGFIAGYFVPHAFNPDIRVLSECLWWVKEDFRMGRSGLALLNAFVDFGKKHAQWISFCLEHHSPVNPKTLLKRGFKLHEQAFLLEVQ
jgi:hypothetical protein